MKRTKVFLRVMMVAAACSLLILSGGSNNGFAQPKPSLAPFAGEYGGYTQSEKGAVELDYTAIHQRTFDYLGNTSGKTYAQIYPTPTGGVSTMICTSTGTATPLDDNVVQITGTQTCDNSEFVLNYSAICIGVGQTSPGFTELFCTDTTEEFPGYEAINLTILKRK